MDAAGNLYIADANNRRVRRVDRFGTITTVAGGGRGGDGGPATAASLGNLMNIAVDTADNLYIAEGWDHRVRKVDRFGTITTVAGTGARGFSGDGGPATVAQLSSPRGVAVDAAGNLYIADRGNGRVRRVDRFGTITTVAGTGEYGYSGDGGPATAARLRSPMRLAVDAAGNLYIAADSSFRVFRVDRFGTLTTVAGTGVRGQSGEGGPATAAQLDFVYALAADAAGNLYVAGPTDPRVRRVDSSGRIATVAGNGSGRFGGDGGPATAARLSSPNGLAVDAAGNLYIAGEESRRVRRVDPFGTITTVAGTGRLGYSGDGGLATAAQLVSPQGLAVDTAGNLYIADSNRVRKVDRFGTITTVAGTGEYGYSGDGGPATAAPAQIPQRPSGGRRWQRLHCRPR